MGVSRGERMYAYLGRHVPAAQKPLFSPDTPVKEDQYSYKLTTLDVDAFKYWFGVKDARVDEKLGVVLHKAGLLPPMLSERNPLTPRELPQGRVASVLHQESPAAEERGEGLVLP